MYQFIRDNGGWDNWNMVLVESYNACSKRNLESRERYWLETLRATLNKQVPTRTRPEWCEENQKSLKHSQKSYRDEHKEKEKERNKKYRTNNNDKISQWQKNYREEHKEKEKERNKIYRAKQFARKVHEFIYS